MPIRGVTDSTHLYSKYRYSLLMACTMDSANHVLQLAFGLMKSEWVQHGHGSLKRLKHCVKGCHEGKAYCVISDRHKGIEKAMTNGMLGWQSQFAKWRICI